MTGYVKFAGWVLAGCGLLVLGILAFSVPTRVIASPTDLTPRVFLPLMLSTGCADIPGETYNAIGVTPPPTDRPAEQHADLNLALRGYRPTTAYLGLVDIDGPTDSKDPQLKTLFGDQRLPTFTSAAQVYDWDWSCNCRGNPITDPPVSLIGMGVAPGEAIHVPASGYNIGTNAVRPPEGVFLDKPRPPGEGTHTPEIVNDDPTAYEVLVLYAAENRITLKYTREDNVVRGYTLHVENICVAPSLLALYYKWNTAGRASLPALKQGQAFGTAKTGEIGVVIRDNGSFMDPRSRKDWWKGF